MSALASRAGRDLRYLFDPGSIAIVGASDEAQKYGNWLALRAVRGHRPAYLVNRSRAQVLGRPTAPSLERLGEPVDLAVIAVPARAFEEAVADALRAGVRAIVGITSGLGELGGEHLRRQQELVTKVRDAGAVLLGPNCLGVLDHSTGLDACINDLPRGAIALISQSGNVALDLGARFEAADLGVSRFVSIGNQADIDVVELVDSCVEHEETAAIALYCEGFPDGRELARAALRATEAGKPVVLLTVGRGEASARGAVSHTGSMVTSEAVVQAACAASGAELVTGPAEMADLLQALTRMAPPRGRRVGVIADGGGHASLASDALEAHGLSIEPFTAELRAEVAAQLPAHAGTTNPVDIAGAGEQDIDCFLRTTRLLVEDPGLDAVLLTGYFGGYHGYSAVLGAEELRIAHEIPRQVERSGKSMVAHLIFDRSPAARALRAGGVAVYRDADTAAWALQRLTDRSLSGPAGVPVVPPPGRRIPESGYWPSRRHLAAAGIPFVPAAEVATLQELTDAAATLEYPLVLKALVAEHKSDLGGVVLGIRDRAQLLDAWHDLRSRLNPPTCSVEQMADLTDAVEMIVGTRRDRSFGTVVLVGLGGIYTELLRDTRCALGPVDPDDARRMVAGLRGAPVLHGFRGRPSVDVDATARLISELSHFAAAHPEIGELECNPVAVTPTGAVALDARIVLTGSG